MKLTKSKLKQIIKEELGNVLGIHDVEPSARRQAASESPARIYAALAAARAKAWRQTHKEQPGAWESGSSAHWDAEMEAKFNAADEALPGYVAPRHRHAVGPAFGADAVEPEEDPLAATSVTIPALGMPEPGI